MISLGDISTAGCRIGLEVKAWARGPACPAHAGTEARMRMQCRCDCVCGLSALGITTSYCTSRYAGEFCQHLNPCHSESSPRCQNGGTCRIKPGASGGAPSFVCECPLGFSASLCEIRVPAACDSAPCLNGATCRLTSLDTYECDCPPGMADSDERRELSETCMTGFARHLHAYRGESGLARMSEDLSDWRGNVAISTANYYEIEIESAVMHVHFSRAKRINIYAHDRSERVRAAAARALRNFVPAATGAGARAATPTTRILTAEFIVGPARVEIVVVLIYHGVVLISRKIFRRETPHFYLASFRLLGAECSHEDHCASQPCRNGGKCVADNTTTAGYSCSCPPGFTGSRCTEDVVECSSGSGNGPCHHGRCFNTHGSYTCVCEPGYTGRDCDAEYVPCEPSPCLHGGICTPVDPLRYECECPTVAMTSFTVTRNSITVHGRIFVVIFTFDPRNKVVRNERCYRGQNCEVNIDDCPGHKCQNGATCVDGLNKYTCECPPTFTGQLCETDVDECALRSAAR
ncbi:Neurogenic locus Notch protein [Eumeta japonica]|uniref:Neurogenic locus Notch protein n=1 Tax=Eumeta variegata TaxID=151549 RepID=A0A4C1YED3_EUMVA|nr:Neurogenic locus Notch protein [Eumeta japonica]